MAAEGYPGSPRKGDVISGLTTYVEGTEVFHGGTVFDLENRIVRTAGGRVLSIVALRENMADAC
ncbi:hypothetical protein COV04_04220 [Candidatus Uhrbacteria bacterium CG10_big_fil_rev_8_21_14_0_10_48_11]|uniref:Glycinamide ribonucleotide synthetase n=1 Tax=Candidatus Uhrbacteria bacterium CG10_big_fil_rev_8_21_14_0_10_48_11 TaxID=1975037 RepID=A0A2M8LDS7_9BACT|nr:MAG: hypothetical protein COV04_04220 [Candidatus Uhrbacteria bacterium CG10_big_fil_rev_8_21_14_0_10_48_11]